VASFAIVRADESIDKAEGASVQDVSDRYGWPGNGTIRPWEAGDEAANTFATPEEQAAVLNPEADDDDDDADAKAGNAPKVADAPKAVAAPAPKIGDK
jgi:hypothetical protein